VSLDRTRVLMSQAGLDGLITTSYEGVAYLSGVFITTQRLIPDRLAAVILPLDGDPTLVVCTIEEAQVRRDSRIRDIRGYVEFATSPVDLIAKVVQEKGLAQGRLGLEMKILSAHYFLELGKSLPRVSFEPVDHLLDTVRMVKSSEELALLEKAALSTDQAIRSAYEGARPGVTDKVIADAMANAMQASGADSIAFLVLGAGPSAELAHPMAVNRPIEEGDVVRCDVGGYYSGYYSDLARTAVVGKATAEQKQLYHNLWQIHEELIAEARPGVRAKDLYFACKRAFDRRSMHMNLPHVGHSLGLGLHEHPILNPFNETILEENTVLAIEPVVKGAGPIFHVEDLVVVRPEGGKVLSRSADWSELFVIGA
jgi:Xaa-Pro dipeptidase